MTSKNSVGFNRQPNEETVRSIIQPIMLNGKQVGKKMSREGKINGAYFKEHVQMMEFIQRTPKLSLDRETPLQTPLQTRLPQLQVSPQQLQLLPVYTFPPSHTKKRMTTTLPKSKHHEHHEHHEQLEHRQQQRRKPNVTNTSNKSNKSSSKKR